MKREEWIIKNTSQRQISIGDLPLMPTISPGASFNIFNYYEKEAVQQSVNLLAVLELGWLQLTKVLDGQQDIVLADETADSTATADRAEVVAAGRLIARSLGSLNDAGVAGEIGFFGGNFYGYTGSGWESIMVTYSGLAL